MIIEHTETEILIKETAKMIFFTKGHISASTKEIAKEAGVNRALIHYYFRSRDLLFNTVLEEAMRGLMGKIAAILGSEMDLRTKIRTFLDAFDDHTLQYPYLETFLVTEMAKNPEKMKELHPKNSEEIKGLIDEQLKLEIAQGKLLPITVNHFMTNLMSMCNYPLIGKPILQTIFGFEDTQYKTFLMERKKVIYQAIFNEAYTES